MAGQKLHADNNFHCFDPPEFQYWRAIATGQRPISAPPTTGAAGYNLELKNDIDGHAAKNGGLLMPQETKINRDVYYRFFGTTTLTARGAAGAMSGGWWIDADTLAKIDSFAKRMDYSVARSANLLLVVPAK